MRTCTELGVPIAVEVVVPDVLRTRQDHLIDGDAFGIDWQAPAVSEPFGNEAVVALLGLPVVSLAEVAGLAIHAHGSTVRELVTEEFGELGWLGFRHGMASRLENESVTRFRPGFQPHNRKGG